MENIYKDDVSEIIYDNINSTLYYNSTNSKIEITDILFKENMSNYIKQIELKKPKNIIIDMRDSTYTPDPNSFPAIDKILIQLYNNIGLQKRAFIGGNGGIEYNAPSESDHSYRTKWFESKDEALHWLAE